MWRRVTSQSPLSVDGPNRNYIKAFAAIGELLRSGRSLSGHERNCFFLNTQDGLFVTASAASGFDYPEDGRAIGLTDWDHDGDLDLWLANRTGPRIRFLRNDAAPANWISFQLTGTRCNRDAIGARLELYGSFPAPSNGTQEFVAGTKHSPQKLIRTVRAGHGFLSEASKRIHFGLGNYRELEKLVVRWPGGEVEEFTQLQVNRHYEIEQGRSQATEWRRPTRIAPLTPTELAGTPLSSQSRIVIHGRVPMPAIDFRELQADARPSTTAGPVLVNLWSTTCPSCLRELSEFAQAEERLRASGVQITALNVDVLLDDPQADLAPAKELLSKLKFPFAAAAIDTDTSGALDIFHRSFLNLRLPLPVPSSFLATADGRVAVIYRGPVTVEQIIDDVQLVALEPETLRARAMPFPGRWLNGPFLADPKAQALAFLRSGFVDVGQRYLESYLVAHHQGHGWGPREGWPSPERLAELCDTLADLYRLKKEPKGVLAAYQLAIQFHPNSATAHAMLGKGLVEVGQRDAGLREIETAHRLAPSNLEIATDWAIGLVMAGQTNRAKQTFQQLIAEHPEYHQWHWHLARLHRQEKQYASAITELRRFLQFNPNHNEAIHLLAWLLVTSPVESDRNVTEAPQWINRLPSDSATRFDYADLRAALHAATGQFDAAVSQQQLAIERAQAQAAPTQVVESLKDRLARYQRHEAYYEPR